MRQVMCDQRLKVLVSSIGHNNYGRCRGSTWSSAHTIASNKCMKNGNISKRLAWHQESTVNIKYHYYQQLALLVTISLLQASYLCVYLLFLEFLAELHVFAKLLPFFTECICNLILF